MSAALSVGSLSLSRSRSLSLSLLLSRSHARSLSKCWLHSACARTRLLLLLLLLLHKVAYLVSVRARSLSRCGGGVRRSRLLSAVTLPPRLCRGGISAAGVGGPCALSALPHGPYATLSSSSSSSSSSFFSLSLALLSLSLSLKHTAHRLGEGTSGVPKWRACARARESDED
jgi:hypothetical protein